jgi:hypothetical protein
VVKVADFGLSLVKDHSSQELEEMKKIRGSPAFMRYVFFRECILNISSPEALMGSELTPKTDVYRWNCVYQEISLFLLVSA